MACAFCGTDQTPKIHTLRLSTGREQSRALTESTRLDPTRVQNTFSVRYAEVQSHVYTLCHRCWSGTRRRLVILMFLPIPCLFAYMAYVSSIRDYSGMTFLGVFAAFIVIWGVMIAVLKSREPWHRLKRMAVAERSGTGFVVFEGSEDGSTMILPV